MKRRGAGGLKSVPPLPSLAGPIARTWSKAEREAAQLDAWANQLEGLWWNVTPEVRAQFIAGRRPLRECQMSDNERLAVAAFLRRVAENPAALAALQGEPKRGRRSTLASDYAVALDYLATCERLGKSEAAVSEVRRAWKLSRASVLRKYQQSTLAKSRQPGRKYKGDPVSAELARIERANPGMPRDELLLAVSYELRKNKSK